MKYVVGAMLVVGMLSWGCAKKHAKVAPAKKVAAVKPKQKKVAKKKMLKKAKPKYEFSETYVKAQLKKFAPVTMSVPEKDLSPEQQKALHYLVLAADVMDHLFWVQAGPNCLKVRKELQEKAKKDPAYKDVLRLVNIMAGPYNRLEAFKTFYGHYKKPLGGTFYPLKMTKQWFNSFLASHPEQKEAFLSPVTVIRQRDSKLVAVPYSVEYANDLHKAADYLNKAARFVKNPTLKKFLLSRAKAFTDNRYFQSDCDWMDVKGDGLEVTIGPYEVYEDRLFNYKAAFETFIGLVDPVESRKMALVKKHIGAIEDNLPVPDKYKGKGRSKGSPIRVIDLIYATGDAHKGVQTLAYNLPNDEHVRKVKGSKKVLLKNMSNAKFEMILRPIAKLVLTKAQLPFLSFDAYFNHTLMHEISHGVGPGFIEKNGTRTTVNLALKDTYSAIEEAKADVLGEYNTLFFIKKGWFPQKLEDTSKVTYLAGIFRSVRFGVSEAHGKANMIQYNYLKQFGVFKYDPKTRKFSVDTKKFAAGIKALAHDLLMLEAEGNYRKAKAFIQTYGSVPEEVKEALAGMGSIPVDVWPSYPLADKMRALKL